MCSKKSLGSQVVCIAFGPRYVILRNVQGIEVVEGIDDGIEGLLALCAMTSLRCKYQ